MNNKRVNLAIEHLGLTEAEPVASEIDLGDLSYVTVVWTRSDTDIESIAVVYVSDWDHPNVEMIKHAPSMDTTPYDTRVGYNNPVRLESDDLRAMGIDHVEMRDG